MNAVRGLGPGARPLEAVACNLCGSTGFQPLFLAADRLVGGQERFRVGRCRRCGLVFVNPRPRAVDMGRHYPPDFFSFQLEAALDSPGRGIRDLALRLLVAAINRARLKRVARLFPARSGVRLLDVGCGKGAFLRAVQQRFGWQVEGLDTDETCVAHCRARHGIPAFHGTVTALDAGARYSLITMWHYLEHEHDPRAALRQAHRLLLPGGFLLVEVPNEASLENRVFGSRSFLYDVPRHLFDFSPRTLSRLLEESGFEIVDLHSAHNAGGWIGSVQQLLTGGRIYRELRRFILWQLLFATILLPLDFLVSLTRRGSILNVVARKAPFPRAADTPTARPSPAAESSG